MPMILDTSQALDPGDILWILPQQQQSFWYQRLNWLTHFSLTRNELHQRPQLHPWLIKIIETCEIEVPTIPSQEPLLVPTSQWLPNDWLVTIPYNEMTENQFIIAIAKIWDQLQTPSLRLFLPLSMTLERWKDLWNQNNLNKEISIVFEPPFRGD